MNLNPAMRLQALLGISLSRFGIKQTSHAKNASYRKAGPGRRAAQGDGTRTAQQRSAGYFARGMRNWCNRQPARGRV